MFSTISSASPKPQFRAVILCGYGSDLYPLIETSNYHSDHDEDNDNEGGDEEGKKSMSNVTLGQVKALLPVAGKKMIDWVMERVEEAGVYDILVLSPASLAPPLSTHLRARRALAVGTATASTSARVELEEVEDGLARRGTVAVIRWAAAKGLIKSDFILLPCDLLLSTAGSNPIISLATLIDRHRTDDNLMTTLFTERAAGDVVAAAKDGPSEILTIYDAKTSTLLDVREMDEFDEDEVPLRTSLLSAFPSPSLSTNLLPTQLYIFSSTILSFLSSPIHDNRLRHLENFHQVAAWISRLAWRDQGRGSLSSPALTSSSNEDGTEVVHDLSKARSTTLQPQKRLFPSTSTLSQTTTSRARPSLPSMPSDYPLWGETSLHATNTTPSGSSSVRKGGSGGCKIVIWRKADGWCGRGNTVAGWVEMNRAALKLLPPAHPAPTNLPPGVFISTDSLIAHSVYQFISEKVGIKRCIIGKGCKIGKGSKLTGVVIMEGVTIGEGVRLDNCVLSNSVQIKDRAILKDCELGRDVIVEADASIKNEQLVVELD